MGKRDVSEELSIEDFQGKSPPPDAIGSIETINKYYWPNREPTQKEGVPHLKDPSMTFRTDLRPKAALERVLRLLEKMDFTDVLAFMGPYLPHEVSRVEGADVSVVIDAVSGSDDQPIPWRGLKVVVEHQEDPLISAHVTIGRGPPTRVRIKFRGRVLRTMWRQLERLVQKRFKI